MKWRHQTSARLAPCNSRRRNPAAIPLTLADVVIVSGTAAWTRGGATLRPAITYPENSLRAPISGSYTDACCNLPRFLAPHEENFRTASHAAKVQRGVYVNSGPRLH
jgi:hypothetical protein